jgi:hypothetical protein
MKIVLLIYLYKYHERIRDFDNDSLLLDQLVTLDPYIVVYAAAMMMFWQAIIIFIN